MPKIRVHHFCNRKPSNLFARAPPVMLTSNYAGVISSINS